MYDEREQSPEHGPLAGFTVGVTAARRADELGALLERRGAAVLHAPALRIVPLSDDSELLAATKEIIGRAPDIAVATTAIGFRGWVEAADGWGLGEDLLERLREVRILARGPKVKGAIRAAGLNEEWSPASESMAEVLDRLLEEGVDGLRIAVQLHGEPLPGFVESLRAAGAEVVGVPVYRWLPRRTSGRWTGWSTRSSRAPWTRSPSPARPPPRRCCPAPRSGAGRRPAGRVRPRRAARLRRPGHRAAAPGAGRRHGAARTLPSGPAGPAALP